MFSLVTQLFGSDHALPELLAQAGNFPRKAIEEAQLTARIVLFICCSAGV